MARQADTTGNRNVGRLCRLLARKARVLCLLVLCLGLPGLAAMPAQAQEMAKAGRGAKSAYLVGEYKLPAGIDATVTPDVATELWASVYRPAKAGKYPVLVFLHGNHGTCGTYDKTTGVRYDDSIEYTFSGTCPEGYVPTPNHRGYDYLATDLASRGYIVVSINANRGVTVARAVDGDTGLNLRRGRLVLRHLQQLAAWNAGTTQAPASLGFALRGLMDFAHVGLMGHSRGGEGVRAALAQYRDADSPWPGRIGKVGFEAVYEIAPVDGQTSRTLDADGVAWNVLLPGCDGDVADLEGVRPLDRMIIRSAETVALPKSSFQVFGANHNFYNSEWQESDAYECTGQPYMFSPFGSGSANQRTTAQESMIPFFLAHVGSRKQPTQAALLDPSQPLPASLLKLSLFARGHVASLRPQDNFVIDNFTGKTGISSRGVASSTNRLLRAENVGAGDSHDSRQAAALVAWNTKDAWFQSNATATGMVVDSKVSKSLEFRVKLEYSDDLVGGNLNPAGDVDFSIRLVDGKGGLSTPVALSSVARVYRPVSAYVSYDYVNTVFQTVRVPLKSFAGADLRNFKGVRFAFDRTAKGNISLADIRLVSAEAGTKGALISTLQTSTAPVAQPRAKLVQQADTNRIVAVRRVAAPQAAAPGSVSAESATAVMEVELASSRRFPITDALPTLSIGGKTFQLSRFEPGASGRIIFSLSEAEYQALPNGADTTLQIGGAPLWQFGNLTRN